MQKFLFYIILFCFQSKAICQWKLNIETKNQLSRIILTNTINHEIQQTKWFDQILTNYHSDTILSNKQLNDVYFRVKTKSSWGLLNSKLNQIVKCKFKSIDILREENQKNISRSDVKILGFIAKNQKDKLILLDTLGNHISKLEFGFIQFYGVRFDYPELLNDPSKYQFFHQKHVLQKEFIPIAIANIGGKIDREVHSCKFNFPVQKFDDQGEIIEILHHEEVYNDTTFICQSGKWNILDLSGGHFISKEWVDSVKIPMIKLSDDFNLDSLNYKYDQIRFLDFSMTQKEFCNWFHEYNDRYFLINTYVLFHSNNEWNGITLYQSNSIEFNQLYINKVKLFKFHEFNALGLYHNNELKLYNMHSDKLLKANFNEIYEEQMNPRFTNELNYYKCMINGNLGLYCLQNDSFIPLSDYQNVDFLNGNYQDPRDFYENFPRIYYYTKKNGFWGVSTINWMGQMDSVAVPYEYDTLIETKNTYVTSILAKKGDAWLNIDYHNNILTPMPETHNVLYLKEFYDYAHGEITTYFILLNPTGIAIKDKIEMNDFDEFENVSPQRKIGNNPNQIVLGGKILIYNEMGKLLVDPVLYDSIFPIVSGHCHQYQDFDTLITNYEFFDWGNPTSVKTMFFKENYQTTKYFRIIKDQKEAIISAQGELILPFDTSKIAVEKHHFSGYVNEVDSDGYEYEVPVNQSKLVFKNKIKTVKIGL